MSMVQAGKAMERPLMLRMEAVTYSRRMTCRRCGNEQEKGALMHAHPPTMTVIETGARPYLHAVK